MMKLFIIFASALLVAPAIAADAEVSVANGERISIIGGCHDCHTVGYAETAGTIDSAVALKGNPVGYQGPWGTNYAPNLRIIAAKMDEDAWVKYLQTFKAGPPMPWFNVHHMTEPEIRSLHQYILSLGEPGDPQPENLPLGEAPKTPYLVFAPPTMPAS